MTAYDSTLFGFSSSSMTISFNTNNNWDSGTYVVRVTGTLTASGNTAYADFTLTVIPNDPCYDTEVVSYAISDYTYDVALPTYYELSALGWT
jgi:hypothetical protein